MSQSAAPGMWSSPTAAPSAAATGQATAHPYRIQVDDEAGFSPRRRARFTHNFDRHPLMQLDALQALAERLYPLGQCRFLQAGQTVVPGSEFSHKPKPADGRSIAEVFRRLEETGSWIALYNIQLDPTYQRFLWDEAYGSVRHLVDPHEAASDLRGFVFLSAPPSVTPFHIDRENNFWMQLRGRKTINVWDRDDREVVAAHDVENFIVHRTLDGVKFREEHLGRSLELDCGPGEGVYFPTASPHMTRSDRSWVTPGNGITASIGIDFYTDVTRRGAHVHALNRLLRKAGLRPTLPGRSDALDRVKAPFGRAAVALAQRLRGFSPPPGF